jgi:hypothetical protein
MEKFKMTLIEHPFNKQPVLIISQINAVKFKTWHTLEHNWVLVEFCPN